MGTLQDGLASLQRQAPTLPVRVVMLASEQVLPMLQFILHMANLYRERLEFVGIFHTNDDRRSKEPATRVKALLKQWAAREHLQFVVELQPGGMLPADVRAGLQPWLEASPGSRWLVNVTNGTKPMSLAATELALRARVSDMRVMYRELGSGWFEFRRTGDWIELVRSCRG